MNLEDAQKISLQIHKEISAQLFKKLREDENMTFELLRDYGFRLYLEKINKLPKSDHKMLLVAHMLKDFFEFFKEQTGE